LLKEEQEGSFTSSKFDLDKSERIMAVPRHAGNGRQIETAVFFDHVAYNRFSAIYNDAEIEEMVLAYVNQVDTRFCLSQQGRVENSSLI
jgi:hypothetical protein